MEILLAVLSNVKVLLIFAAILLGIAATVGLMGWSIEDNWRTDSRWARSAKNAAIAAAVAALLACVPTVHEVWEVRIALVKYELASPENVQQAAETIERIGKKLECKYLGDCGEPKK